MNQLIIRNNEQFADFVHRIPKRKIQKKNPAPLSDDPFVNGLLIDFNQHILLVSIRSDNMYAKAPIVSVLETNDYITAMIEVESLDDTEMMASVGGIGTYYAVKIPLLLQEIVFTIQ